ncbi:metal-dependent hydrolase [Halorussus limi]|uniref:Metal-dependent hydrolase n=1 Tax=Halorussus limi TaxID=2938695 RepID=A0A8U0HW66_9EURY|nr:metal-dependent hydrolase [Halorussus limi]UPV75355.1 metal-dependent hydrolase [Halorussus limi]
MVDVAGHLGMALVWLAPAWFVIDRRKTAATFVAVGFWFGMLPDVDLVLSNWFPTIKHHGVFHTVLVVTILAAIIGPLVGWILKTWLDDSEWFSEPAERSALSLGFVMVWVAGLSHIFADMLSAPDIAEAIEPLWPLYQQSIGIDLVWYNATWFNWGLLALGVLLNVAFYYWQKPSVGRGASTAS